jgi:beta-glucosidase
MSKRKQRPRPSSKSGKALGHDPLEGLDMGWLDQEKREHLVEILGHDPFEDMDMAWLDREEREQLIEILGHDPFEDTDMAWLDRGQEEVPAGLAVEEKRLRERSALEAASLGRAEPAMPLEAGPPIDLVPVRSVVPEATFHFPADFKWGVATAAHQVEGQNVLNDWWAWEQADGHIKQGHTSGLACDWWENAEADFDRAAAIGLNALRLSVEWSRVEPRPGEFDESALERYSRMLQGLRARGVEPMVTLHHFTNPLWLAEQGGWENPETIALFSRFVRRVVETLGNYCDLWCTINEPNVYGYLGYLSGVFPPGQSELGSAMRVIRHLLEGHAAAYREIHALQPQARVGLAHNVRPMDPANPSSLLDRYAARLADRAYNQAILTALSRGRWKLPLGLGFARKLKDTLDWIGLDYYTRGVVAFDRTQAKTLFSCQSQAEDAELLDGDYGEFYPRGMFRAIQRLSRLGLPIYITENGIPDDDDDQRPSYLVTHLHQMWHAIQLCYPVMGYFHWTLVDNFEWAEGWTLRFGLIGLDRKTQDRVPRRSANLFADLVRANAITPQIIDTYVPELRPVLLPG